MAIELHPLLEPYYTETEPDLRKNKLDAYSSTPSDLSGHDRENSRAFPEISQKGSPLHPVRHAAG